MNVDIPNNPLVIGHPENGVVITMYSDKQGTSSTKGGAKSDEPDEDKKDWSSWGEGDDFPTKMRYKVEKSTIAARALYMFANLMYGLGPAYYRLRVDEKGELKREFFQDNNIDTFFAENDIPSFLLTQAISWSFYKNTFQEFILSRDRKKIVSVYHLEPEFCRLPQFYTSRDKLYFLLHSTYFAKQDTAKLTDEKLTRIPLLNKKQKPRFYEQFNGFKFANHTKLPTPGRFTYAMPYHAGLFKDKGWVDVSNKVPEAQFKLITSQVVIKYQIKIPDNYWERAYPPSDSGKDGGWVAYTREQKDAIKKQKFAEMDRYLKADSTLAIFKSHYQVDKVTGKSLNEGWIIEAIDDKIKDDAWIPSSAAADEQIARTIGIDTSVSLGSSGGGSIGAGSGSDKRVGADNTYSLLQAEEQLVMEPLRIIRDFNGWGSDIHFTFLRSRATRLDENKDGTQIVS